MKKVTLAMSLFSMLFVNTAFAGCMTDQGPYKDTWGFARFPFYNNCNKTVSVSLCVKSYPGDYAVFNRYYGSAGARSSMEITNGKWDFFHSYRWVEDGNVSCPF